MSAYLIGLDLGGSSVKAAALKPSGEILDTCQREFDVNRPRHWAETVQECFENFRDQYGPDLQSIGLSAPGIPDSAGQSIAHMPGRLEGLENLNWANYLNWAKPLPVLNDAQAALLGETWLGAAKGQKNVVMITLGTGVGGAALLDGHLLRGQFGRGGHLGHICLGIDEKPDICGTPGSLELMIGNCSIETRTQGRFKTTFELLQAVRSGSPEAKRIWDKSVKALACGIASLINILDPQTVILGGGIARAGEQLMDPLRSYLDQFEWRPGGRRSELKIATLGEWAGAYGAAKHGLIKSEV